MKRHLIGLAGAAAFLAATMATAAPGHAEVCGDVGGRHVSVGGCTHIAGDVAAGAVLATDDDMAAQVAAGLPPCYTPDGAPYYTPAGQPCN